MIVHPIGRVRLNIIPAIIIGIVPGVQVAFGAGLNDLIAGQDLPGIGTIANVSIVLPEKVEIDPHGILVARVGTGIDRWSGERAVRLEKVIVVIAVGGVLSVIAARILVPGPRGFIPVRRRNTGGKIFRA